jgi:hypothetical protein
LDTKFFRLTNANSSYAQLTTAGAAFYLSPKTTSSGSGSYLTASSNTGQSIFWFYGLTIESGVVINNTAIAVRDTCKGIIGFNNIVTVRSFTFIANTPVQMLYGNTKESSLTLTSCIFDIVMNLVVMNTGAVNAPATVIGMATPALELLTEKCREHPPQTLPCTLGASSTPMPSPSAAATPPPTSSRSSTSMFTQAPKISQRRFVLFEVGPFLFDLLCC